MHKGFLDKLEMTGLRIIVMVGFLICSIFLLYGNWTIWHNPVLGAAGLALYLAVGALGWAGVIRRSLSLGPAWQRLFGFLLSFYITAFAIGIPVVVWKYHRPTVAGIMFLVGLAGLLINRRSLSLREKGTPVAKQSAAADRSDAQSLLSRLRLLWSRSPKATTESKDLVRLITRSFDSVHRRLRLFSSLKMTMISLFVLSLLFTFFLFHARTGIFILSPWDALSTFTLILFFAMSFIIVWLILSKKISIKLALVIIIAFSYLQHLYLPAVYETGFGGDKWRHLAAAQWLQEGNVYTPSIWGEADRSMVKIGPISAPEALVAGNKTSYAAQWSVTIMLSESLGVALFWVDLLLVFLLWSLFLPLILYQFGKLIFSQISPPAVSFSSPPLLRRGRGGSGEQLGLLFAFLPMIFYTFQSEGAITIPVSLGHLFFFFVFLLWAYYVKAGNRAALVSASVFSLLFYWGYILNFFVLIGIGVLAVTFRRFFLEISQGRKINSPSLLPRPPLAGRRGLPVRRSPSAAAETDEGGGGGRGLSSNVIFFTVLVIISILTIPFLEVFQGLSSYPGGAVSGRGVLDAFANAFGQLSGFIGTVAPPDYIDQGNFLYNQTRLSSSRLPLFSYRLIPFAVSMGVWTVLGWGIYRLVRYNVIASRAKQSDHRNDQDRSDRQIQRDGQIAAVRSTLPRNDNTSKTILFIAIIFFIALSAYFLSWSFTEGVHILARRLNETIVFLMILFFGWGTWLFLHPNSSSGTTEDTPLLFPSFTKEGAGGGTALSDKGSLIQYIPLRKKILALSFILALAATSTYASGPKLQLVTADELAAAKFVWQEHQNDQKPYCVIANTWPLLGLEAVSGRLITAGNFPVYTEYAQPERVKIFNGLSKSPSATWIEGAFRITGAEVCYYMTENRWINDNVLKKTIDMLGEPRRIGTVYIWRIEKQNF